MFPSFSFLVVRICCFFLSYATVNGESLGFGLLVSQNKQFESQLWL